MNSLLYSNCSHYSKCNSLIVPILFHAIFRTIHGSRKIYAFILRYLCNLPQNSETIVQQLQDHS